MTRCLHIPTLDNELVDEGLETGAGVSVWHDGLEVVRLNTGWAEAGHSRPWRDDTLVLPSSPSKSFVTPIGQASPLPRRSRRSRSVPGTALGEHPRAWLEIPDGVPDTARTNSRAYRQSVFGATNLRTTASSTAEFFSRLTGENGSVRGLLGPELLAAHVTRFDGSSAPSSPGRWASSGRCGTGTPAPASPAGWTIAAALGDDLTVVGEDRAAARPSADSSGRRAR
ncbi:beta-lactamase family protein [Streptomyces sp. NBC_00882]|uniref:hypothetical protein n=1 Tax=Streptomyces TaxID=1883 RepID=UPI00386D3E5F|nr:beta-lactamase family protein [Streptomyces sp. NBC_00882]WSZ55528.1 beta-lactamase family protein [Streptomyces canus]